MVGFFFMVFGLESVYGNDAFELLQDHGLTIIDAFLISIALCIFIATINGFVGAFYENYSSLYKVSYR